MPGGRTSCAGAANRPGATRSEDVEQVEQDDDGDGNSEDPKQNAAHGYPLKLPDEATPAPPLRCGLWRHVSVSCRVTRGVRWLQIASSAARPLFHDVGDHQSDVVPEPRLEMPRLELVEEEEPEIAVEADFELTDLDREFLQEMNIAVAA